MLFGSCKDVTVGPTAILAALLSRHVAKSVDFAYLAAFLSGCCILLLGILQLGFLLDFISKPVISGFTAAAALQIGASQLRNLFRVSGASGDTFVSAMINFFKNISTVHLWDTVLGISCIVTLLVLKRSSISASDIDSACRLRLAAGWQYVVRARNAIVVCVAAAIAAILHARGTVPFALTGKIEGGLPELRYGRLLAHTLGTRRLPSKRSCLVLLSVTLLADAFYFIPRAALGAIIIVAMAAIVDLAIVKHLWRHSKGQLAVYLVTVAAGAGAGLEYGILAGALADLGRLVIVAARPAMPTHIFKVGNQDSVRVTMAGVLSHVAAERVARVLRGSVSVDHVAVLDGKLLTHLDIGVAENLISVIKDMEGAGHSFLLWNFSEPLRALFEDLQPGFETRFVNGPSIDQPRTI
ncbi:hypothetical protein ACJJTC_014290 [Scirpophaga incertulas]